MMTFITILLIAPTTPLTPVAWALGVIWGCLSQAFRHGLLNYTEIDAGVERTTTAEFWTMDSARVRAAE